MRVLTAAFALLGVLSLIFAMACVVVIVWSDEPMRWLLTSGVLAVSSFLWFLFSLTAKNFDRRG